MVRSVNASGTPPSTPPTAEFSTAVNAALERLPIRPVSLPPTLPSSLSQLETTGSQYTARSTMQAIHSASPTTIAETNRAFFQHGARRIDNQAESSSTTGNPHAGLRRPGQIPPYTPQADGNHTHAEIEARYVRQLSQRGHQEYRQEVDQARQEHGPEPAYQPPTPEYTSGDYMHGDQHPADAIGDSAHYQPLPKTHLPTTAGEKMSEILSEINNLKLMKSKEYHDTDSLILLMKKYQKIMSNIISTAKVDQESWILNVKGIFSDNLIYNLISEQESNRINTEYLDAIEYLSKFNAIIEKLLNRIENSRNNEEKLNIELGMNEYVLQSKIDEIQKIYTFFETSGQNYSEDVFPLIKENILSQFSHIKNENGDPIVKNLEDVADLSRRDTSKPFGMTTFEATKLRERAHQLLAEPAITNPSRKSKQKTLLHPDYNRAIEMLDAKMKETFGINNWKNVYFEEIKDYNELFQEVIRQYAKFKRNPSKDEASNFRLKMMNYLNKQDLKDRILVLKKALSATTKATEETRNEILSMFADGINEKYEQVKSLFTEAQSSLESLNKSYAKLAQGKELTTKNIDKLSLVNELKSTQYLVKTAVKKFNENIDFLINPFSMAKPAFEIQV
jgi:hypothetical protein